MNNTLQGAAPTKLLVKYFHKGATLPYSTRIITHEYLVTVDTGYQYYIALWNNHEAISPAPSGWIEIEAVPFDYDPSGYITT